MMFWHSLGPAVRGPAQGKPLQAGKGWGGSLLNADGRLPSEQWGWEGLFPLERMRSAEASPKFE